MRKAGAGGGHRAPTHAPDICESGVMQLGNSITGRRRGWGSPGALFPRRWRPGLAGGIWRAPLQAKVEGDERRPFRGQLNFCSLIALGRRVPSIRARSPHGAARGRAACPAGHRRTRPGALERQSRPDRESEGEKPVS